MKQILLSVLLAFSASAFADTDMKLPIRGIADGDTIKTSLKLPCPLCSASVRIRGIDTPETSFLAKCPAEKAKGLEAKAFLINLTTGQETMMARNVKWDKYGGRIDAIVEINGVNVGDLMISKGFAKPYTGVGPKPNWCI
jgi:endonuclease YncB( thermonuclease family)